MDCMRFNLYLDQVAYVMLVVHAGRHASAASSTGIGESFELVNTNLCKAACAKRTTYYDGGMHSCSRQLSWAAKCMTITLKTSLIESRASRDSEHAMIQVYLQ